MSVHSSEQLALYSELSHKNKGQLQAQRSAHGHPSSNGLGAATLPSKTMLALASQQGIRSTFMETGRRPIARLTLAKCSPAAASSTAVVDSGGGSATPLSTIP